MIVQIHHNLVCIHSQPIGCQANQWKCTSVNNSQMRTWYLLAHNSLNARAGRWFKRVTCFFQGSSYMVIVKPSCSVFMILLTSASRALLFLVCVCTLIFSKLVPGAVIAVEIIMISRLIGRCTIPIKNVIWWGAWVIFFRIDPTHMLGNAKHIGFYQR